MRRIKSRMEERKETGEHPKQRKPKSKRGGSEYFSVGGVDEKEIVLSNGKRKKRRMQNKA